ESARLYVRGRATPSQRGASSLRGETIVTMIEPAGAGTLARREKPEPHPARPYFSSGPCAKPPGWAASKLAIGSLGRSHRAKVGKGRVGGGGGPARAGP